MNLSAIFLNVLLQAVRPLSSETPERVEELLSRGRTLFLQYGPRILMAIVVLIVGLWLIKVAVRTFGKIMAFREVDATLRPFLRSILSIGLKLLLFLSVASMMGIETTSFIAALGAAGLAIGLALQGSLSNFAGGVLILLFKPFRVGDFIGAQGHKGTVREIQILYTIIDTVDNKRVVIPNGNLSNNDVVNYTANDTRRLDLKLTVSYNSDIQRAKQILNEITESEDRVLRDPPYVIGVDQLNDSGVVFTMQLWLKRENMVFVQYDILEAIKLRFEREGIIVPVQELEERLLRVREAGKQPAAEA